MFGVQAFTRDTARAMSGEKVKTVANLVDAWNERNVDGFLRFFDANCEVVFRPEVPEPGPFRGHVQLREWTEGFLAAWESHRVEENFDRVGNGGPEPKSGHRPR